MMVQRPFVCADCGRTVSNLSYRAACPDCGGALHQTVATGS